MNVTSDSNMLTGSNSSNPYKNYVIEVRPRLRSANVHIILKECAKNIQIVLNKQDILITGDNFSFVLPVRGFEAVTHSLSNLYIDKNSVSFRFSTNGDNNLGTFKAEILQNENTLETTSSKVFLKSDVEYRIVCLNCRQLISKSISFTRVLPLPSDRVEPSDWFCHKDKPSVLNLTPRKCDAYYSVCYVHLNRENISGVLETSSSIICKTCLAWLGTFLSRNSCQLWYNTVGFQDFENLYMTNPLEDIYLSLKDVLSQSFLNSTRIVLQYQKSKNKSDFILLWVLEKRLNVLSDAISINGDDCFVAKVLFQFHDGDDDSIVHEWINNVTTPTINISKPMMVEFLKHLYVMHELLPKHCNISNNFFISYVTAYS